jgi:hypothetical protein
MSVELFQTEMTYTVELHDHSYSVTRLEDMNSGYTQYDVFDENGDIVEDDLENEIITYLEENI